jgi:myo-inositol-1-phosphate synthase
MPSATFTTVVAASALVAGVALSNAIPALGAAIGGAHTPGARAAAAVDANGDVLRSTGVTKVTRIAAGEYCIELDPNINVDKTVPVATLRMGAPSWDTNVAISSGVEEHRNEK